MQWNRIIRKSQQLDLIELGAKTKFVPVANDVANGVANDVANGVAKDVANGVANDVEDVVTVVKGVLDDVVAFVVGGCAAEDNSGSGSSVKETETTNDPYYPAVQAFHRIFLPWYDSAMDMTDAMLEYIRILHECATRVSGGSTPGGLDDLFPLIVWTISRTTAVGGGKKGNDISLNLCKGLGFLEIFIEDISGESAFYLCAIMSAVEYLVKCFGHEDGGSDGGGNTSTSTEKETKDVSRKHSDTGRRMMLLFDSTCNHNAINDLRSFLTHADMEENVLDSMI